MIRIHVCSALLLALALPSVAADTPTCAQLIARGNALAALGNHAAAWEQYLAATAAPGETLEEQIQARYLLALSKERQHQWRDAAALYESLLAAYGASFAQSPWVRRSRVGLGQCNLRLGRWSDAQQSLQQVADDDHEDSITDEASLALAGALSHPSNPAPDLKRALVLYGQVMERRPELAEAAFGAAECYRRMGLTDDALALYHMTSSLDPEGIWGGAALAAGAAMLDSQGRTLEAREQYNALRENEALANTLLMDFAHRSTRAPAMEEHPPRYVVRVPHASPREGLAATARDVHVDEAPSRRWTLRANAMQRVEDGFLFSDGVVIEARTARIECATATLDSLERYLTCGGGVRLEQDLAPVRLNIDQLTLRVPDEGIEWQTGGW